jgi:putative endonuclease
MTSGAWLYMLRCADGSYYTGTTRTTLEIRIAEHNSGHFDGYTAARRPVTLVYSQWFDQITDAIAAERQIKGWSRAKKEALMRSDFDGLRLLAKRKSKPKAATDDASSWGASRSDASRRMGCGRKRRRSHAWPMVRDAPTCVRRSSP